MKITYNTTCLLVMGISAATAFAVPPTVYVTWKEVPGPVEGTHYMIHDADPDYPDVELIHESLTWCIWSEDSDNPDWIGDIGVISSPHPENFGVTIENDQGGSGAREVKGIILDPTDAAKYSVINGGQISGDLTGDLFVEESSGESGGSVSLTVDGNVEGDITAGTISSLSIGGNLAGDVNVDDVTGTMSVTGDFQTLGQHYFAADDISGSLSIGGNAYGVMDLAEFTGSLSVTGNVHFEWLRGRGRAGDRLRDSAGRKSERCGDLDHPRL